MKKIPMPLLIVLPAILLVQTAYANPICENSFSDSDGDGWGWEQNRTCRVQSGTTSTDIGSEVTTVTTSNATCVDEDNDGWGWNGVSSCRIGSVTPSTVTDTGTGSSADLSQVKVCYDTDPVGDGWGWDGATSCRVEATPTSDDGAATAVVENDCVDTGVLGDGWGWDGVASCRVSDRTDLESQTGQGNNDDSESQVSTCEDTQPIGDGWGWNGSTSCRVTSDTVESRQSTTGELVFAEDNYWQNLHTSNGSHATPRHEAGAVTVGNKLYLLGGRGNRPIDVYDSRSQQWSQLGYLPMEMHHFQPVALGGKIYVLGAFTCCFPNESTIDNVWEMDINTGRWSAGAAIPADRRRGSASAVVYNNKIYLVGGNINGHVSGAVAWLDEYDPASEQWRRLADAPHPRDHAMAAVANGKLVVAGGRRSQHPDTFGNTVGATNVYDFTASQWQVGASIPTQRAGVMTVAAAGHVVVIGGESNAVGRAHDEVELYRVADNSWHSLRRLNTGRHSGGAALLNGEIHVIAGASSRGGGQEISSHESLRVE